MQYDKSVLFSNLQRGLEYWGFMSTLVPLHKDSVNEQTIQEVPYNHECHMALALVI
jgi:hypothetical protein